MPAILGNIIAIGILALLIWVCGKNVYHQLKAELSGKGCSGCGGSCSRCCGGCSSCGAARKK